jgi:transcriptional regulator with PAS, ATPase and Fis domain
VGKELFARLIHTQSPRAKYPFVALNCAAFSADIIESELFGYEKGAFTGARVEGKEGLLEVADGGTLFLDEVIDLHAEIQAKLLRVLEEKEFYPLGGTRKRTVDTRVISACNKDLWKAAGEGRFRKDLFFRLATIRIDLPPLRERSEDILPLVQFFVNDFNDKYGKHFRGVGPQAERLLLAHPWPGNVRELKNTIERVILLEDEETIRARHLRFLGAPANNETPTITDALRIAFPEQGIAFEEIERQIIQGAYERCQRNKSKTARFLKMPRHILIYRLKKLGILD